jgi:hypothetical protein
MRKLSSPYDLFSRLFPCLLPSSAAAPGAELAWLGGHGSPHPTRSREGWQGKKPSPPRSTPSTLRDERASVWPSPDWHVHSLGAAERLSDIARQAADAYLLEMPGRRLTAFPQELGAAPLAYPIIARLLKASSRFLAISYIFPRGRTTMVHLLHFRRRVQRERERRATGVVHHCAQPATGVRLAGGSTAARPLTRFSQASRSCAFWSASMSLESGIRMPR